MNKTKAGWREIGTRRIYFRSAWEANYARYLDFLIKIGHIKSWEYEPETFWFDAIKRGVRSYKPDFKVIDNNDSISYHEVKGYLDSKSVTKLKRMKKYHPSVFVYLVSSSIYRDIERRLSKLIEGWE